MRWLAALAACAGLASVAPVQAAAARCDALTYQQGLAAAAADLGATPPATAAALAELARLEAATPEAAGVLRPIAAEITAQGTGDDDARTRLTAMAATLAHPPGSVCAGFSGAARRALSDVYASPDFRHLDDNTQQGWLATVLGWLGRLLGGVAGVGWLTVLVGLAILAGLAALAVRRWRSAAPLRAARLAEPGVHGDDPDAEWRAAGRAAAAGDHREAVRRAFRSALLEVARRGDARVDPAWTTRELLRRCRAGGEVLAALAPAAALFDRAWYSGSAVTAADWEAARERCAAVRRLASRSRSAVG